MLLNEWKEEKETLQLVSQILGKHKLATAFQEPQWAHVVLDITAQGFSTGLLHFEDKHYQIDVNLLQHKIIVIVEDELHEIALQDGTTIKSYYLQIKEFLKEHGVHPEINTKPQEMSITIPFEQDETHHHYNETSAQSALRLMQIAYRAESAFINPLRARKVKPGLFWGTFDVSCILLYNEHVPFPDPSKVIERAAFDESMIEFGFWFGDDKFEGPTFFVLPYPFANRNFECTHHFPEGSYYDESMAEFILPLNDLSTDDAQILKQFFTASYESFKDYLEWENCEHYHKPLSMEENKAVKDLQK
ncbi:hypothetical protein J9174_00615 [Macrococcoides canis]|uniref:DUF5996 family protein n=1 Tax=Macrococcoides canis TaxID=1855823 RepID=UPI001AEBCA1B|nr:DUF5996 family protein [Macrococcus canis]QTQ08218.1 hypothetical protein J9174_00615 [Macrococcus canis]